MSNVLRLLAFDEVAAGLRREPAAPGGFEGLATWTGSPPAPGCKECGA